MKKGLVGTDLKVRSCPAGRIHFASHGTAPSGVDAIGGQTPHLCETSGNDGYGDVSDVGQDGFDVWASDGETASFLQMKEAGI